MKRVLAVPALILLGLAGCARDAAPEPAAGDLRVFCGRLVDGLGAGVRENVLVEMRGGRIASLRDGAENPADAVDLGAYTCLPGLIDMHTHIAENAEDTADLSVYFTRTPEEALRAGEHNAAVTLRAGFTTVRDVGAYVMGSQAALKNAIGRGDFIGPRMRISGSYLTIRDGGGDLHVPGFEEPEDNLRFHFGVARGPEQFAARAQALLATDVDLLKVIASGAVLAHGGVPGAPEMTQEEIAAVVRVAHAAGKTVAAHAHGAESIRMAIAAGVDTVEHASYLDDAGMAAAREHGVALAMDVWCGDWIDTEGRAQNWPEEFLRKNLETTEIQRQAFTRAVAAGVPIVFATDAGVYEHGLNGRQFAKMVERGMTPMQAIQSATSVASRYLGDWGRQVGALEAGRFGDLIAVRADPLADVRALESVDVVIKGGVVVKRP